MAPRYAWWGYVKWVIRDQPVKCRELAEMQRAPRADGIVTPTRGGLPARTTESMALCSLPGRAGVEYAAVESAIENVKAQRSGAEKLKVIDLVFWKQSHTLHGAAIRCHVSYDTAQNWHGDFIRLVAHNLGLYP